MLSSTGRYALLLLALLIALFPLFWLVRTSISTRRIALAEEPVWLFKPTFDAYRSVFESDYPRYLMNSAVVVTASVAMVMILGTLAGYSLARFPIRGKEDWFFYVITTRMGPPVAFALPFYIIYERTDLLDSYLGMIVMYVVVNLAFAVWMTRSFFEDIPKSQEESAMVDGLSRLQAFLRVTLPQAAPGLIATAIFIFIIAWNEFFYAAMLTRDSARTFTTALPQFVGFSRIRWEEMAAASVVSVAPVMVFAALVRRNLVRGLTFGAVK
jgi:multiple sugar transport system permease protein